MHQSHKNKGKPSKTQARERPFRTPGDAAESLNDIDVYQFIDKLQRAAYQASGCRVLPSQSFYMTLAELEIILCEGFDYQEERVIRHADLKTSILNAPRVEREGGGLFKVTDFLPRALRSKIQELTEEDQAKRIFARGEALAAKCKKVLQKK